MSPTFHVIQDTRNIIQYYTPTNIYPNVTWIPVNKAKGDLSGIATVYVYAARMSILTKNIRFEKISNNATV